MTITQNPNGTFEFSRGGVLWAGFSSREKAQEAAYDLTRGIVPTLPHHEAPSPSDAEIEILHWIDDQERRNSPTSPTDRLCDIIADLDRMDHETAEARLQAMYDAEERMRHGTVIDPGGPGRVHIEREVCNDYINKEKYGREIGTNYTLGETLFAVDDDGTTYLRAFGEGLDPALVARDLTDLMTLLSDRRVRDHLAQASANLETIAPADIIKTERHTFCVADNEPYTQPWTTYTFGTAQLDINDDSGGNLCLDRQMISFQDCAALVDLVRLLTHPRILTALAGEPIPSDQAELERIRATIAAAMAEEDSLTALEAIPQADWTALYRLDPIALGIAQRAACYGAQRGVTKYRAMTRPTRTAPAISVERHDDYAAPCTDYVCDGVTIEVLDEPDPKEGVVVYNFGGDCISLSEAQATASALRTLLSDPRVKAAIATQQPAA
jgi:hypothetical protein